MTLVQLNQIIGASNEKNKNKKIKNQLNFRILLQGNCWIKNIC